MNHLIIKTEEGNEIEFQDAGNEVLVVLADDPSTRSHTGFRNLEYLNQDQVNRVQDWLKEWLEEKGVNK